VVACALRAPPASPARVWAPHFSRLLGSRRRAALSGPGYIEATYTPRGGVYGEVIIRKMLKDGHDIGAISHTSSPRSPKLSFWRPAPPCGCWRPRAALDTHRLTYGQAEEYSCVSPGAQCHYLCRNTRSTLT